MLKRSRRSSCSSSRKNVSNYEALESKRLLASVGWDGAGQGSAELTYFIGEAPDEVGQETFENVIEQALDVWSDVVDITFTQTEFRGQRDSLDITFQQLDGAGGTLAQAYFPDDVNRRGSIAGDIQFDSAESWEVGNDQGFRATDLLHVAVHEIGHALGLQHSDVNGAVLEATVSPNQFFTELDADDREAILELYAPAVVDVEVEIPTETEPTTETPVTPVDDTETPAPETDTETETETPVDEGETTDDTDDEADEDESDEDEEAARRERFRNFLNRLSRFFNRFNNRFNFFFRFR